MKKIVLFSLSLGALGFVGAAPAASAADIDNATTNGQVAYTTGGLELDKDGDGTLGGGLPADLNFGTHEIQNTADEIWYATVDGVQTNTLTTGKLNVSDKRGTSAGWTVKAKQNAQFANGTDVLDSAALSITTAAATNTGGSLPTVGVIGSKAALTLGQDTTIFGASATTGAGYSTLPLDKFELAVPKTAERKPVKYTTSITWTLSDAPN